MSSFKGYPFQLVLNRLSEIMVVLTSVILFINSLILSAR
jgi:hypothetical protein